MKKLGRIQLFWAMSSNQYPSIVSVVDDSNASRKCCDETLLGTELASSINEL